MPLSVQCACRGDLPREFSFLQLSPNNLILSALKRAEDGDDVILRFFETKGEQTEGELVLFREIKRAAVADLLEREECELSSDCYQGNRLKLEVKPFEIVTLRLRL